MLGFLILEASYDSINRHFDLQQIESHVIVQKRFPVEFRIFNYESSLYLPNGTESNLSEHVLN